MINTHPFWLVFEDYSEGELSYQFVPHDELVEIPIGRDGHILPLVGRVDSV